MRRASPGSATSSAGSSTTASRTYYSQRAADRGITVHELLTELAAEQPVGAHGLIALDWHSGNRSPLVDHELSGLILGQTLATRPEDGYRALIEATAYGTRLIIETFRNAGVPVNELIVTGGLQKNPLLMQIYADVTRMPINLLDSDQGPALGSALHAAVAAGAYPDIRAAAASMGRVVRDAWLPNEADAERYDALYAEYVHAGRLLRPARQRRDAPPAQDPSGGTVDEAAHPRRAGGQPAHPGGRSGHADLG